jgi:hypothetical protein
MIVILMKIIVYAAEIIFERPLGLLGNYLLFSFQGYPKTELVFIMIVFPVILNSLMFWVTDSFLKSNAKAKPFEEVGIEFNTTPLVTVATTATS